MAHHHARAHQLAPRLRKRQDDDDDETTVVIKTVQQSSERPRQTLIEPMVRTSTKNDDSVSTSKAKSSSAKPTSSQTSQNAKGKVQETLETSTASPTKFASTLMVATSSPSVTAALIAATTGISPSESPSSSASSTAAPAAAASSGMSAGAKAGLALGIILGVACILGGVLFLYRRKKNQLAQQKQVDNEKTPMENAQPPPRVVEPALSVQTERNLTTAPRLSLRPVTQFSPTFAAAPQPPSKDSPETSNSYWERLGASSAVGPTPDPFNDASSLSNSPPQDPFGDAQKSLPITASMNAFADPAPAIAAAEAAPLVMAAGSIPRKISRKQVPPPVAPASPANPVSPAWSDNIPASPGPAPTGPPPIAVAGGLANGSAPVPVNNVHRIQLDFKPSMQDELELRAGQLVRMLHEYDDGWALCLRMDRTQQGVVPRTCLSKHPVKPRNGAPGPPRQGPPGPRVRGPPMGPPLGPMGPGGIPQPRPLTPSGGRKSPHPPTHSPAPSRMSSDPHSMSPGPRGMPPNMGPPGGSMSPVSIGMPSNMGPGRGRSNSNAPYAGPPRSMSPGPYGGGPQQQKMTPPPQMGRPRANSASQVAARRLTPPGPSPMNPNVDNTTMAIPPRRPVPGMAL